MSISLMQYLVAGLVVTDRGHVEVAVKAVEVHPENSIVIPVVVQLFLHFVGQLGRTI